MQRSHGKAIKQIILICPPTGGEQQYNACIKLWLHLLQYFSCQGIIEVWVYFTSHGKDSSLVEFAPMKLVINFMPHFSFRMFAVLHSIQTAFPQNKITHKYFSLHGLCQWREACNLQVTQIKMIHYTISTLLPGEVRWNLNITMGRLQISMEIQALHIYSTIAELYRLINSHTKSLQIQ